MLKENFVQIHSSILQKLLESYQRLDGSDNKLIKTISQHVRKFNPSFQETIPDLKKQYEIVYREKYNQLKRYLQDNRNKELWYPHPLRCILSEEGIREYENNDRRSRFILVDIQHHEELPSYTSYTTPFLRARPVLVDKMSRSVGCHTLFVSLETLREHNPGT